MHPSLIQHFSQLWLLWTVLFSTSTRAEPAFPATFSLAALDAASGFRLDGVKAGDLSGSSVSHAGDINGDGLGDLIVGAHPASPNSQSGAGSSYVIYGRQGGYPHPFPLSALNATTGFRLDGESERDYSGVSVSHAGDINGDGLDDLIVGAFRSSFNGQSDAGSSYVIYGRQGGYPHPFPLSEINGTNGFRLDGEKAGDYSGRSVSRAGDVNGDGLDDLIVSALFADPNGQSQAGSSYVIYGRVGGHQHPFFLSALNATTGFRLDGEKAGDRSCDPVSYAGDINGDGLDDLIVGADRATPNGQMWAGSSYVIYGRLGGHPHPFSLSDLNATTGFRLDGEKALYSSGYSVSHAGDINGDGLDDLIVGAPGADPNGQSQAGSSYVIYGRLGGYPHPFSLSRLNTNTGFRLDGRLAGDQSGTSVSRAGDINGDGLDDLIVGAGFAEPNGQMWAGSSYVIYGRLDGHQHPFSLSALNAATGFRLDGEKAGDRSGRSVSYAGDINDDGVDDLIVGAPEASPKGQALAGSSYVIYGRKASADITRPTQRQLSTSRMLYDTKTVSTTLNPFASSGLVATVTTPSSTMSGLVQTVTSLPSSKVSEISALPSSHSAERATLSALETASPHSDPGLIAGAAVGGIALLGSVAALGVFACRRRAKPSPASPSTPEEHVYADIQLKRPEGHYQNLEALPDSGAHYLSDSDAAEVLREGAQYANYASARDQQRGAQSYDDISVLSAPR